MLEVAPNGSSLKVKYADGGMKRLSAHDYWQCVVEDTQKKPALNPSKAPKPAEPSAGQTNEKNGKKKPKRKAPNPKPKRSKKPKPKLSPAVVVDVDDVAMGTDKEPPVAAEATPIAVAAES